MSKAPIAAIYRMGRSENITVSGTAANNATALNTTGSLIRIVSTTACYYKIGVSAIATTSNVYLPADTVEYVGYNGGEHISVIQASTGGTLNITECSR